MKGEGHHYIVVISYPHTVPILLVVSSLGACTPFTSHIELYTRKDTMNQPVVDRDASLQSPAAQEDHEVMRVFM